ncbi:MAG TPA: zinc-dependent alcohol dehydrogenase family protein [Polyangiaceae bacterium]|nr:zinc-dependent alcohol dehydrogenase family protein [Polyangiaceae bacterium]
MVLERPGPISERRSDGDISGHPLSAREGPTPPPGEHEALLRVTACAVCRTDLQIVEGDLEAKKLPIVPGHQIVGRIVAKGAGVTSFREGDRVGVAWLATTCGTCLRCTEGRENLCAKATFTGWDRDGGFATHVVVDGGSLLRLPESYDDVSAAPLLCGGVIGHRSLDVCGVLPGQRLGLYGFGASARVVLQLARHRGCHVYVATRSETERASALALGAEWAGGYDDAPPERLDAAITFAPVGRVVIAALSALERGGTVAINAIHLDEIPAFDYGALFWERGIRSVSNFTRDDARAFLELAPSVPIQTKVEVYNLADANVALERLKHGRVSGAAVLAMPD